MSMRAGTVAVLWALALVLAAPLGAQRRAEQPEALKARLLKAFAARLDRELRALKVRLLKEFEAALDRELGRRAAPPKRRAPRLSAPGWLGVYLTPLSEGQRKELSLPEGGLRVTEVVPGSPAARAGIRPGDVLVDLNGKRLRSVEGLVAELRRLGAGKTVGLRVRRGPKEEVKLQVRLGRRPAVRLAPGRQPGREGPRERPEKKPQPKAEKPKPRALRRPSGRPWLGVVLGPDHPDRKRPTGEPAGVTVEEVIPRSPAARAGLRRGDILLRVGKTPVSSFAALREAIRKLAPGARVRLQVRRGDQVQVVTVTLGRHMP